MSQPADQSSNDRLLAKVPVSVSVRVAERKMDYDGVMQITPGSLITFNKPCDEMLDLYVNNRHYARGEAVKIGEHFGLRIMKLGPAPDTKPRVIG